MNALLQGRYEIIQTLSAGGFGETFVAVDRQLPSQRKVAIKKFKPQQQLDARTYEIVRERFEREAAVLESLSDVCRHVPKLYAFFSEAGDYFLVQEFIEGQTLTALVRTQGRLDEAVTRQLLTSLLAALHEIHAQGIIHRDIKPDNILLRAGNGQPVLIDFGAVKEIVTTSLDAHGKPQRASIAIGTLGYMPAEQSVGRPVYASDLYSLAMTMIFALTGREPHELNDLASGELRWHQHTGKLSQPLTALLDRAVQYDHRERFKNAHEMLDALNAAPPPPVPANKRGINQASTLIDPPVIQPAGLITQPQPVAASRRPMLLAIGLGGLTLAGATTVYFASQMKPPAVVANPPAASPVVAATPNLPARAEVLRYAIERENVAGGGLRFRFTPRADGYLYLLGLDEKKQPEALQNKARVTAGKPFLFPADSWYDIAPTASSAEFTVIFAVQPLNELPFLNGKERKLQPDETRSLQSLRELRSSTAPQLKELGNDTIVTAQKLPDEPVFFTLNVNR